MTDFAAAAGKLLLSSDVVVRAGLSTVLLGSILRAGTFINIATV